jgi:hypothetical protein
VGFQKTHLEHFAHVIERARVCHGPHQVVEPSLLLELGLSLKHVSMNAHGGKRRLSHERLKRAAFVHLLHAVCYGLGRIRCCTPLFTLASFGIVNISLERNKV